MTRSCSPRTAAQTLAVMSFLRSLSHCSRLSMAWVSTGMVDLPIGQVGAQIARQRGDDIDDRGATWRGAKPASASSAIAALSSVSIPAAGGYVVAVAGWRLLQEGSHKSVEGADDQTLRSSLLRQAFYPLTMPLTTGPGTIAVVISLGLSHPAFADRADAIIFLVASTLAVLVISVTIFFSFAYADRIQTLLGQGGTDIAVRLSAFILFCLGVQILWSGGSELFRSVLQP